MNETFGKNYFEGITSNYGNYKELDSDRFWMPIVKSIRKHLQPSEKSLRVIDIGCAYGFLLKRLCKIFPNKETEVQVFGADISAYGLGQVHDQKITNNLVRLDLNDTQKGGIPFENNSFDVITALDVLEHTKDPEWNFKELHRILVPGGLLVAQVPVKDTWIGWIFRKFLDKDKTHINVPGKEVFLDALKQNNFAILEKNMFCYLGDKKIPHIPEVMEVIARKNIE